MNKNSRIYVAGHNGLVGKALIRKLHEKGYNNLVVRTSKELDLRRQKDVESFFKNEKPDYAFIAAAKVGGILANNTFKAEFIYDNIMIAANIINSAYIYGVKKLLNLGSSCIYPKFAQQPIKEDFLLSGSLEQTNESYAIAKIAAIKLCRYYYEQYGKNFISLMPTNLYGPCDNFDLQTSHVLPALIRKFHLANLLSEGKYDEIIKNFAIFNNDDLSFESDVLNVNSLEISVNNYKSIINYLARFGIHSDKVVLWGSGDPFREFLYVEDLAAACIFLMEKYSYKNIGEFVNIGTGKDIQIRELAQMIKDITDFKGKIDWDPSKPDGTPRKLLDISKIKSLGWYPIVDLKEGLIKTYAWIKQQIYSEKKSSKL